MSLESFTEDHLKDELFMLNCLKADSWRCKLNWWTEYCQAQPTVSLIPFIQLNNRLLLNRETR